MSRRFRRAALAGERRLRVAAKVQEDRVRKDSEKAAKRSKRFRWVRWGALTILIICAIAVTVFPSVQSATTKPEAGSISITPPPRAQFEKPFLDIAVSLDEERTPLQNMGLVPRSPYLRVALISVYETGPAPASILKDIWALNVKNVIAWRLVTLADDNFSKKLNDAGFGISAAGVGEWVEGDVSSFTYKAKMRQVIRGPYTYYVVAVDLKISAPLVSQNQSTLVQGWTINWIPTDVLPKSRLYLDVCRACDIAASYDAPKSLRQSFEWSGTPSDHMAIDIDTPWRPWYFLNQIVGWLWLTVAAAFVGLVVTEIAKKRSASSEETRRRGAATAL